MGVLIQEMEVGDEPRVQPAHAPAPPQPAAATTTAGPPTPRDIELAVEHQLRREERVWAH